MVVHQVAEDHHPAEAAALRGVEVIIPAEGRVQAQKAMTIKDLLKQAYLTIQQSIV